MVFGLGGFVKARRSSLVKDLEVRSRPLPKAWKVEF
jgi:hypothetical protein